MTFSLSSRTKALKRTFFQHSAPSVAQALLGQLVLHHSQDGLCGGIIVETEAYDESDPASHSCHGKTARNEMMFGPGGVAYVYRSYGVHWCFNVAVGPQNYGAAVLIRAIEPTIGIDLMTRRRQASLANCKLKDIARGPGRLCQAMDINISHNGKDLLQAPLYIVSPQNFSPPQIATSPRIGISKAVDVPWRFFIPGNSFVSGPKKGK